MQNLSKYRCNGYARARFISAYRRPKPDYGTCASCGYPLNKAGRCTAPLSVAD